ncbi:MAG: hypothetical protein M1825_002647, partial [Sarcosagium campestre]
MASIAQPKANGPTGTTHEDASSGLSNPELERNKASSGSGASLPVDGRILTGRQEHCKPSSNAKSDAAYTYSPRDLKRELLRQQVHYEIEELSSPTALQRFGAPFRSDFGEVAPVDSDLPILRFIFVHHVRNFPFLDQAREKDFWQDKLQV